MEFTLSSTFEVDGRAAKLNFDGTRFSFNNDRRTGGVLKAVGINAAYVEIENMASRYQELLNESQATKKNQGYVYLISDGEYVKIGCSKGRPAERAKSLQVGNARKLEVLHCYHVGYMRQTEALLHKMHIEHKACGEWFKLTDSIVSDIIQACHKYEPHFEAPEISRLAFAKILSEQMELLHDAREIYMKRAMRSRNKKMNMMPSKASFEFMLKRSDNDAINRYAFDKYNLMVNNALVNKTSLNIDRVEEIDKFISFINNEMLDYSDVYDDIQLEFEGVL